MATPHFFIDRRIEGSPGTRVSLTLPTDLFQHLRTLRLKAREHLVFVDAPGHGWELELATPLERGTDCVEGVLVRELFAARRPSVTLVQGISAADRMDQTVRQVTELGVSRVIPLESERSTVRLDAATRVAKRERWQRVARGAAEQSGQLELPTIEPPSQLEAAFGMLKGYGTLLFFWEEAGGRSLDEALAGAGTEAVPAPAGAEARASHDERVAVIVGPEGGFSEAEAAFIRGAGAHTVTLGDTILRTETAAVVACALTLHKRGALGA
jgi:16S rRNA (uracil1498-N3)-methyltransferase